MLVGRDVDNCRAAAGQRGCLARVLAKYGPSLIKIVRCHLNRDAIAGNRSDPVSFHTARSAGGDGVPIVHLHTDAAIGEDFDDRTFEFEHFFLSNPNSSTNRQGRGRPAAPALLSSSAPQPLRLRLDSISNGSAAGRYPGRLRPADAH